MLDGFPEVKEVVGKIGSSEVPTDPMPVESADMIIVLKDKDEWVSAKSRDELAAKMQAMLEDKIPGVSFGFQQPIQMRFNELMSGARQDVVVKIYGEDLDTLSRLAEDVGRIIREVPGAEDIYVEQVGGLSQIVVNYHRSQMSRFGVDVSEVNRTLNTAFAGQAAGMVFEGERRFDMVVRLSGQSRSSIEDVRNLPIATPDGGQVPLRVLASVDFRVGPNQIQRDAAKRRILVGFNVRGRDVESIVQDVRKRVDAEVQFPDGYHTHYGGAFENLEAARERLSIAVPVALLLIFLLLFFSFNSLKHSLLIFTAVPLSAIGGILALWSRGMPFSISAGVGFIALFGVAVLNGIVLIAEFNRLRADGMTDTWEIIRQGTATRLRPVIMTAAVASLGFLPMAISGSEGAEVQRPLATVVIGGLVTSTLLTLMVLPCLYLVFEGGKRRKVRPEVAGAVAVLLIVVGLPFAGHAQMKPYTMEDVEATVWQWHPDVRVAQMDLAYQQAMTRATSSIPKLNASLTLGQYNSAIKKDNNITLSQTLPFPTVFTQRAALADAEVGFAKSNVAVTQTDALYAMRTAWLNLRHLHARRLLLRSGDSLLVTINKVAEVRQATGEGTQLEVTAAATQLGLLRNQALQVEGEITQWMTQLQQLIGAGVISAFYDSTERMMSLPPEALTNSGEANPLHDRLAAELQVAQTQRKLKIAEALPELSVGYFNQTLIGFQQVNGQDVYFGPASRFQGFTVGLDIPVWFKPVAAQAQAQKLLESKATLQASQYQQWLQKSLDQARAEHDLLLQQLEWYVQTGLPNAEEMLRHSRRAFQEGEIDHVALLLTVRQALDLRTSHLDALLAYNLNVARILHLLGTPPSSISK
ncbi:MAG: efflux RND transporter permease subunit [Bacteroidia bacterium]